MPLEITPKYNKERIPSLIASIEGVSKINIKIPDSNPHTTNCNNDNFTPSIVLINLSTNRICKENPNAEIKTIISPKYTFSMPFEKQSKYNPIVARITLKIVLKPSFFFKNKLSIGTKTTYNAVINPLLPLAAASTGYKAIPNC